MNSSSLSEWRRATKRREVVHLDGDGVVEFNEQNQELLY